MLEGRVEIDRNADIEKREVVTSRTNNFNLIRLYDGDTRLGFTRT